MMMVSDVPIDGAEQVGAVSISLPEGYTDEDIKKLYDRLWTLERDGQKLVGGHTTKDGEMLILNYSGLDTSELCDIINTHLGNSFAVGYRDIYAAFIGKEDYGNAIHRKGHEALRDTDNLQSEATRLLREALNRRKYDVPRRGGILEVPDVSAKTGRPRRQRSDNDEIADEALPREIAAAREKDPTLGVHPSIANKKVVLTHWSTSPTLTEVDPEYHGTNHLGAEFGRGGRGGASDFYRPHSWFGIGDYTAEPMLGTHRYQTVVDGNSLYDFEADPWNYITKRIMLMRGDNTESNLITVCTVCHDEIHRNK